MDIDHPLTLLGGLSPRQFMRRHWHKKPLLVRAALLPHTTVIDRAGLLALAARDDVESRLVQQSPKWALSQGPFKRRALPPFAQTRWTLLVQGLDLHVDAARGLLDEFRFVPEARLDDLMVSYASDGGGVGPHVDSYDVFLLQLQGKRRWRVSAQTDLQLREDLPLKILKQFRAEQEFVLDAGDMLYLPPRYAHEGVAVGECLTASVGFRAPTRQELGRALLERMADQADDVQRDLRYRDPSQPAVANPARLPPGLQAFALGSIEAVLKRPEALACALGEYLTEPKPGAWFDSLESAGGPASALVLDRATRMLYDDVHIFINGESLRASGRDARLMQSLADQRCLSASQLRRASGQAQELLRDWKSAGWLHGDI